MLRIFLLIISVTCCLTPTYARMATPNDASYVTDFYNRDITVNKDGSSTEIIEFQISINKEHARNIWSQYKIKYNSNISSIKILKAKTIAMAKNGEIQEYKVSTDKIENKEIATQTKHSFDKLSQILIAFNHVKVGNKIYLKYELKKNKTIVDNFFASDFVFGSDSPWLKSKVKIKSKLPLYMAVNDPDNAVKVTHDKFEDRHIINMELTKPAFKAIVDERHFFMNKNNFPWISVSTHISWNEFGNAIAKDYYQVIEQPLPKLYKAIVQKAQNKKNIYDKLNVVTSELSEKIQYLTNARTTEGRLIPQDLAKVDETRLGDCKDYSMALIVILRELGIKAYPVVVHRGLYHYPNPNNLPAFTHFNHAIAKVTHNNKDIWVDPTNFASMPTLIFPDIADRKVLIIDEDNSRLERIPNNNPGDSKLSVEEIWNLENPDKMQVTGTASYTGLYALSLTGLQLNLSNDSIKNILLNEVTDTTYVEQANVQIPDLKSRIVSDLEFGYNFTERNNVEFKTSAGTGIKFGFSSARSFITENEQKSDLPLGNPRLVSQHAVIKDVRAIGEQNLDYMLNSKWANIHRKVVYNKDNIEVFQFAHFKKKLIDNKELNTPEYREFRREIEKNFLNGVVIIVEKLV